MFLVLEPGQEAGTVCLVHVAVVYVADPVMEEARLEMNASFIPGHLLRETFAVTGFGAV